jgi:CubicO group peptidase (beta-lactamase class C family)
MTIETLEACVSRYREQWGVPGVVVGIYRDGEVSLLADGIGHLRAEWPMRGDNLFRIASISKVFTATAAMMLVEEGKLDLDTPVKQYVPELHLADPAAEASITMRQLLSHASGIYGDFFDDFGDDDGALAREIAHLHTIEQLTRPGELWHYCNSGFDLAGHVIATITGQSYEDVIRERIFNALGMERAGFFGHEMITWPHAVGHDPVEPLSRQHEVANQHYPRNNNPSGAVITNAEELLRFAAMHMNDGSYAGRQLISPSSARAMREIQIESGDFADHWGIGWDIRNYGKATLFGHGGSTSGFQSQLTIYPEQNFAVCIWTNSGHGRLAINPIEDWILEHEFGLQKQSPATIDLPGEELSRLAGSYRQPLGEIEVQVEDNGLRLSSVSVNPDDGTRTQMPETTVKPVSSDRFIVLDGPHAGEIVNFFPRETEEPVFLRRHGRLFRRQ